MEQCCFNGILIPKGVPVLTDVWTFHHDPEFKIPRSSLEKISIISFLDGNIVSRSLAMHLVFCNASRSLIAMLHTLLYLYCHVHACVFCNRLVYLVTESILNTWYNFWIPRKFAFRSHNQHRVPIGLYLSLHVGLFASGMMTVRAFFWPCVNWEASRSVSGTPITVVDVVFIQHVYLLPSLCLCPSLVWTIEPRVEESVYNDIQWQVQWYDEKVGTTSVGSSGR